MRPYLLEGPAVTYKTDQDRGPAFTLYGDDPLAPMVLRLYASLAGRLSVHDADVRRGFYITACEMEEWYANMYGEPVYDTKQ
jgi:hypothetical protein